MELLDKFTKSWKRNYLLNLRERSLKTDGSFKETGIRIGDIVLLKDDNSRRTFWKLAKVENVIKGPDGIARVATIKVLTNDRRTIVLRRSVKHLIPMEVEREEDECNRNDVAKQQSEDLQKHDDEVADRRERPRRDAKVIGEIRRKDQMT